MKTEARIQQEIVVWFNNKYPKLRGLLCYNNNNSVGGRRGSLNKYLGTIPGRSDMVLYYEGKAYMIELKTAKGKQSPIQIDWQKVIVSQGFEYYIVRNLEEFKKLVVDIIWSTKSCADADIDDKRVFHQVDFTGHCFVCDRQVMNTKKQ